MNVVTVKEVAELLKVKPATVYAWAEQGLIPSFKANGARRFVEEDILRWVIDCVKSSDGYTNITGKRPRKGGLN